MIKIRNSLKNKHIMFLAILFINLILVQFISINYLKAEPVKRALIIAIGDYPDSLGHSKINSTNDIALIKHLLLNQGFEEANIVTIKDNEATKQGITESLLKLITDSRKGDYVVIHYSGHGQQISDNNGDEIDYLDESLVCWDAPAFYSEGYRGEKHMRDDEFGVLISALRLKVGKKGQVLVLLDSCHSGTGTRGEKPAVKIRGGIAPLFIPGISQTLDPPKKEVEKGFGINESNSATRGGSDDIAALIIFAGAGFDELNYETTDDEGNGVGSLSYSIAKAFNELEQGMTYRGLFNRVHSIMSIKAPRQTPMIEGDIDYVVFNGNFVIQENYFTISEIINDNEIKINGGKMMGLSEGDVLGLYNSGIVNTKGKEPEVKGKVISADNFNSTIRLESSLNIKNILDYWVFIKEHNFENSKIPVSIKSFKNKELELKIKEELTGLSLIRLDDKFPDLIIEESGDAILIKTAAEDLVFKRIVNDQKIISKCIESVKAYSQSKFIKELNLEDNDYQVEINFVSVKAQFVNEKIDVLDTLDFNEYLQDEIVPAFGENDQFLIRVTNTGKKPAYFNIIDLQPDGLINAIIPPPGKDGKEYLIKEGQTYIIPDVLLDGFYEPYGTEVFKVFATKEPINLSPIISSKGLEFRGSGSPLETMLNETFQSTRGPKVKVSNVPAESSGSTFEYIFKIVK